MKNVKLKVLLLSLILLTAFFHLLSIDSTNAVPIDLPDQGTVFVTPSSVGFKSLGENFTISVNATGVTNIYAVEVYLRYNPLVLEALNITKGDFLTRGNPETPMFEAVKNVTHDPDADPPFGRVHYVATLLPPATPVTGSESIINVTFTVVGEGASTFDLIRYTYDPDVPSGVPYGTYFVDDDGKEWEPVLQDGTYGSPVYLRVNGETSTKVTSGQNVNITGHVFQPSEEVNVTGLTVSIHYRKVGETVFGNFLQNVTTNVNGDFSYQWKNPDVGSYELKASSSVGSARVESNIATLLVEAPGLDWLLIGALVAIVVVVLTGVYLYFRRARRRKAEEEEEEA